MKTLLTILLTLVMVSGLAVAKDTPPKPQLPILMNVRAAEVEPNNDCATASGPLTAADPSTGEITAGDQDWFSFAAVAGAIVTFQTSVLAPNAGMDTKLYLMGPDCTTQLAYDDDGGDGLFSLFTYTFATAGTYFLKVTGYGASTVGFYTLSAAVTEPLPNDTCAGAPLLNDEGLEFTIDLCDAVNDYNPTSAGCTGYAATGKDVAYAVRLQAGETLDVTVTPVAGTGTVDLSIYLVSDCGDVVTSCVVGADDTVSGQPEAISYLADAAGEFFLIVDAYSGCAEVTVVANGIVATEAASWSNVKAMYH